MIIKKYSHGVELEKAESTIKMDANLTLSTKHIYNRRVSSPVKLPNTKPMLFSVMSKHVTHRK